jgi:hypothetical protein
MEEAAMMEVREAVATIVTESAIAIAAEMRDARAMPSASAETCATKVSAADVSTAKMSATEVTATEVTAAEVTAATAATTMAAAHLDRQIVRRRLR